MTRDAPRGSTGSGIKRSPLFQKSKAFTLVEMLVVISIIAVLASLLLPALTRAKFSAKNTVCRNNLRQLGLALNIYVETHDQYVDDDECQTLLDIGRNINTRASVFVCPLIKGYVLNGGQRSADGYWTYSYNAYGVIGGNWFDAHLGLGKIVSMNQVRPTKASMVKAPSAMIALGDSADRSPDRDRDGHLMLPWFMPLTVSDKRWTPMATNPNQQQPTYKNHHGLFNRVFCDSHVDSEEFNKPFDKGDDYLRRYNNDNEPHRDLWLRAGGGP